MTGFPTGGIVLWPSGDLGPVGDEWQVCDGRGTSDAMLGSLLGTRFGPETASGPPVPDLTGRFARGAGKGDTPGVAQDSSFQAHGHTYNSFPADTSSAMVPWTGTTQTGKWSQDNTTTGSTTVASGVDDSLIAGETRPANMALHFLVHGETDDA
jgi:microcystin-dependent protein